MSKKAILIILAIVVLGVLGAISFMSGGERSISVDAAEVSQREITEVVSASGRIQPKTKVDITSEINGEIIALPVSEGMVVQRGQLLVVLDTVQIASDVTQAGYALDEITARLSGSKTIMEQNKEEFERQERLYNQNLTSETAYKDARYAYLNSDATYEAMKAQAKRLESAYAKQLDYLQKAKIVAPMAGVVTYLDVEVGEIAAAQTAFTQGKTLMTISDLSVFEVEVEVDETEINKVELGQDVSIEVDAIPDTTFEGRVVEIGNTAILEGAGTQDQSTNFRVKVTFLEPYKKLRPGMSATVDITTSRRDDAIAIPFSSVVVRNYDLDSLETARAKRENMSKGSDNEVQAAENDKTESEANGKTTSDTVNTDSTTVKSGDSTMASTDKSSSSEEKAEDIKGAFVVRDGKVVFVKIETGIADQKYIEVTSGLKPGDTVVSGPYKILRTISDGDAVQATMKDQKRG